MNSKLLGLIASSGSAQGLLFVANFSLIFFYSSEDIARYGFYITIGSLFSVLSSIRLDYFAFFSKTNDPARELVLSVGLWVVSVVTVCLVLVSYIIGSLGESTALVIISIFSFSLYYLVSQCSLMVKDYSGYGWSRIILGLMFLFFLVSFSNFGVVGLLFGYCCAQCLSSMYLLRKNNLTVLCTPGRLRYAFLVKFRERLINTLSTSVQFLSPALPILLGSYFFDRDTLGAFFWVSQMLGAGAAVVKRSLMGYLSAELMHDGKLQCSAIALAKKILKTAAVICLVNCALAITISILAVRLYPEWKAYVEFLPMLALLFTADALVQPLGSLLPSINREKLHLSLELARLLSVLGCFGLIFLFDSNIYYFAWLYSLVMTLFYFLSGSIFCCSLLSFRDVRDE